MKTTLVRVLLDDGGVALVEYALLAGAIAVSSFAAMQAIGDSISTLFSDQTSNWTSAAHSGQ